MAEKTCMEVQRLDRTQPPPGYEVVGTGGASWAKRPRPARWSVRLNGQHLQFEQTKTWGIAAAWAHYEREHDPPGMWARLDSSTGGGLWGVGSWWFTTSAEAAARAAAWAWYWRRAALAAEVERKTQVKIGGAWVDRRLLLSDVDVWPRCLAWSEEDVTTCEAWLKAEQAVLQVRAPEVLRA